jgi:hypothetical protein
VVKSRLACAARQASSMLASLLVLCVAQPAWACPACTTRSGGGLLIPFLIGAMILTPYVVSTVVLRIVRKAEAERALEDEAALSVASVSDTSSRSHLDPASGPAPARA